MNNLKQRRKAKEIKSVLNVGNFLVSISLITTLIWFHGYSYEQHYLVSHIPYLYLASFFYLLQFWLRGYLSCCVSGYLKEKKIQLYIYIILGGELMFSLLCESSLLQILSSYSTIENHNHFYTLIFHSFLLVIVGIELGNAAVRSTIWKLPLPLLFILSFVVLISVGSSLLMLPEMTSTGLSMNFEDAMFISISANCVTGLSTVDVGSFFSFKGKLLIMLMIQLGGLNIIAFASYYVLSVKKRNRLIEPHEVASVKEILSLDDFSEIKHMVKLVIISSLFIELVGAFFLYKQWGDEVMFKNSVDRLFFSIFHAISAFNNAGFTLFSGGFANPVIQNLFPLHISVALLIILGGIGFTFIEELYQKIKSLKGGGNLFTLQSSIALNSSLILIMVGMLIFLMCEAFGSLSNKSVIESFMIAFFQSVTTRTAGFNTIELNSLASTTLIGFMFLMFVGASSGSTGGGIKTSTFVVLLANLFPRKQKDSKLQNQQLFSKAKSILFFSLAVIIVGTIILCVVEPNLSFEDLLFEEVSAFATVGLSTGITAELSLVGKIVIMTSMFIGRIGSLALVYALLPQINPNKRLETNLLIG